MEAVVTNRFGALEVELRSDGLLDREVAATRLAEAGRAGAQVLASVATDQRAPPPVRVTALRHLPTGEQAVDALHALLSDTLPVLRVLALNKVEGVGATSLRPLVEKLTRDPATFWDLDEEIVVAQVAARVLRSLMQL